MSNNYINLNVAFCIFINFAKIQIFQRNFIIYFPFTLKKGRPCQRWKACAVPSSVLKRAKTRSKEARRFAATFWRRCLKNARGICARPNTSILRTYLRLKKCFANSAKLVFDESHSNSPKFMDFRARSQKGRRLRKD